MKRKVALVLSSGGARGIAHIGAIEEIESRGYEISSIVGCSMGSLVGGMYASGNLETFKKWMFTIDKRRIWSLSDISISANSLVKGDKIIRELQKIIPDRRLEECPTPCSMVATDIRNEREVVFNTGSMYEAIRASISMPFFLRPQKRNQMLLVDGGLINPLPLNRAERNNGELLFAVNVSAFDRSDHSRPSDKPEGSEGALAYIKQKLGKLPILKNRPKEKEEEDDKDSSFYAIMDHAFGIMIEQNCENAIAINRPDVLVSLPMNSYSGFDYDRARELYDVGRRLTAEALDTFEKTTKHKTHLATKQSENTSKQT